jgi:hypothetical protein
VGKRIGRITYEGLYVIITVPADWKYGDPLPPPSPDDQWYSTSVEFLAALGGGPYDRRAINRRPSKLG